MGEDGRGWERRKEEAGGDRGRQGEAEKNRKARLALRLGRRALGTAIREEKGRRKGERMDEMLSMFLP